MPIPTIVPSAAAQLPVGGIFFSNPGFPGPTADAVSGLGESRPAKRALRQAQGKSKNHFDCFIIKSVLGLRVQV